MRGELLSSDGKTIANAPDVGEVFVEFRMHRQLETQHGYVIFGLIDEAGEVVNPPKAMDLGSQVFQHLRRGPLPLLIPGMEQEGRYGRPMLQFQLFCEKESPFSDAEREAIRLQFAERLALVRQQSQAAFEQLKASQP